MKDRIPPEEKLLRLIRGKKKPQTSFPAQPSASSRPAADRPVSPGGGRWFPAGFRWLALIRRYSLPDAEKATRFAFALAVAYLAFSFLYPLAALRERRAAVRRPPPAQTPAGTQAQPSLDSYLAGVANRAIFSNRFGESPASPAAGQGGILGAEALKDLALVGIISGVKPQAAIEDKRQQKTFYLGVGQAIGEFQIEEITEGKVILSYRGQRYELSL